MITCKAPPQDIQDYIKHHFSLINGELVRDDRRNSLGSIDKDGYVIVKVKKHQVKAHRLVWFLAHGEFPATEIDHINRNRQDNHIENLRLSNRKEQVRNCTRKANPDTGVVGIRIDRTKGLKKNFAFNFNGKTLRFYTLQEAIEAKRYLMEGLL